MILRLALASLKSRRQALLLTALSLWFSGLLVLSVDHLRHQAKNSFVKTLSQTDLIVGARSGPVSLMLYSVFRLGNATNNIRWDTYLELEKHSGVAWLVPLSLGDSHRGFRVLGTNTDYFSHYKYGQQQSLAFAEGRAFSEVYDVVLGAQVARQLGYKLGDSLVLAHGTGVVALHKHTDKPFTVVGILQPTGTAVDNSLHVSLEAIEAIHLNWQDGTPAGEIPAEIAAQADLTPQTITAILVGLKNPGSVFTVQQQINQYPDEALLAILPGATLAELWDMLSIVENLLLLITLLVFVAAAFSVMTNLLISLQDRSREFAILRALGARPSYLFALIELEVAALFALAALASLAVLPLALALASPYLLQTYGLIISINPLHEHTLLGLGGLFSVGLLLGVIPAGVAYRQALALGLSPTR
jgi:putative ABC transport system permease protein